MIPRLGPCFDLVENVFCLLCENELKIFTWFFTGKDIPNDNNSTLQMQTGYYVIVASNANITKQRVKHIFPSNTRIRKLLDYI